VGNYAPDSCNAVLLSGYHIPFGTEHIQIGTNNDFAYVPVELTAYTKSIISTKSNFCPEAKIGDQVIILGYPTIGSKTGITVTEGIVSGEETSYWVTSAKIDKGNSGGAAILVKDNCYLGIPSSSVVGIMESLGRILKASIFLK